MILTAGQLQILGERFDAPQVRTILLVGSYARGDAGPYSDIDLLRLVDGKLEGAASHLWLGKLVTLSDTELTATEA